MDYMRHSDIKKVLAAQKILANAFVDGDGGTYINGVDYSSLWFIEHPKDILQALDDMRRVFENGYETVSR